MGKFTVQMIHIKNHIKQVVLLISVPNKELISIITKLF